MIYPDGTKRNFSKGFSHTKTGRMELMALLSAIDKVPADEDCLLTVYADSMYAINMVRLGWVYEWAKSNFINKANKDVLKRLHEALTSKHRMTIKMVHVKGHQKNIDNELVEGNTIADMLADYKRHTKRSVDLPD